MALTASRARATTTSPREVSLTIDGMTCGACAARIERRLNRLDGVQARVNYATERATVVLPDDLTVDQLIRTVSATGYSAQVVRDEVREVAAEGDEVERRVRSLRRRLIVSALLFMPLCDTSIAFSIVPTLRFPGWQWLLVVLAAPVVTWAAWPFYQAAVRSARHGVATMDTLVSMGILSATGWSLYAMFFRDTDRSAESALYVLIHRSGGSIYLDVAAGVTTFLLLGRYFEAWSRKRSGSALRALATVGAKEATVLDDSGVESRRPTAELRVDDRFVVRPGETVATDGEVVAGQTAVDRRVMTGESLPAEAGPGDGVLGGTVALTGRIVVRATKVGGDTQLAQMLHLVERAQNEKAAVQKLADRIANVFVPLVVGVALITLISWWMVTGSASAAFSPALSVLIIACPCALGLATPAALFVASGTGARFGIFFKGYRSLEASRAVDTVVLDKTGTLTEGRMAVAHVEPASGTARSTLLRLAGAVEAASEHPVGRAVAAAAAEELGALPTVESFLAQPGLGVSGVVDGDCVSVGRPGHDDDADELGPSIWSLCRTWEERGCTVVVVRRGGSFIGLLAVSDVVRPSAAPAVSRLRRLGLDCLLLTGDSETTAGVVAGSVGVDRVVAGALPTEKVAIVRQLQDEGRSVAMVGDGVNDAPALAVADLGLAIGSGTDVAINAADLIIVRSDLRVVATAITLARRTLRTIRGNLAWAFAYNLVAIPVAAAGLLNPLIAGAAMALSSGFVVWNSSRLSRIPPP